MQFFAQVIPLWHVSHTLRAWSFSVFAALKAGRVSLMRQALLIIILVCFPLAEMGCVCV